MSAGRHGPIITGLGLMAVGVGPINVSAWPYTMADLERAEHIYELPCRETLTVNIDYQQTGVGGDNSWGARPHSAVHVDCG
jgi:beta-galactosidase